MVAIILQLAFFNISLPPDMDFHNCNRPRIAIIDSNTLAVLGLKSILQSVVPIMEADTFGSFAELSANNPERYFHYFVSINILLQNRLFFTGRRNKTIVLTLSLDSMPQLAGFHSLCVNVPEDQLVRNLLALEQSAHANGRHLPAMKAHTHCRLSDREIEVMALIVQGYINKEIAGRLNIGLATVITHRKNIMEKLGVKSVSALTIYAVMNGYVDINRV